ncbi:hypothetical protein ASE14_13350 [Agromyces sp. Root81]|nr:hypothetical protein ASE14_13350 [Agromyces sp. Root81]
MVVVGHHFVLIGEPAPRIAGMPIHTVGVAIFFTVSGYLIAQSVTRTPSARSFLWKRFIRIVPGLACVVLVTVFIIGPAISSLAPAAYFSAPETWSYLLNLGFIAQYDLPGVFETEPNLKATVNGSLWTLGVEVCCYIGALLLGRIRGSRLRTSAYVAAAVVLAGLSFASLPVSPAAELCVFFALGALASTHLPNLVGPARGAAVAGAIVVLAVSPLMGGVAPAIALWLALPTAIIWVGRMSTPGVRSAARFGDLSYGIYLWGYLVAQLLISWIGLDHPELLLVHTLGAVGILGALSWWLIERPALRFKGVTLGKSVPQTASSAQSTRAYELAGGSAPGSAKPVAGGSRHGSEAAFLVGAQLHRAITMRGVQG